MAALTAVALLVAVCWGGVPVDRLAGRLLKPLLRLTIAVGVGLLLGIIIESANFTAGIGRVFAPLLRFGHLKEPSALAFSTAFFSAVSASAILMNAYQDNAISRRELTISALILTFPAFFAHLPSMFFIITPFVGVLGVYYLLILLGGDILRTFGFLLYARLSLPAYEPTLSAPDRERPSWSQVWRETQKKFVSRLYNILVITIPIFVLVFLAREAGAFDWLRHHLTGLLKGMQLPVEAFSILIFSLAAETAGGFAAAGALLEGQALRPAVVLFTLVLGTILSSPMRAVRHQLPYYLGIYTPALGLKLLVLSQVFRVLSLLPFLLGIYYCGF
ncbi:MAG: hypothetical protein QME75_03350 [Deltaproteobacteria bacterium]|nr:hypothetical protein [Deltaproteobacteria bacterium]